MQDLLTRRGFLGAVVERGLSAAFVVEVFRRISGLEVHAAGVHLPPVEAEYYEKQPGGAVQCHLCPRQEYLSVGQMGFCRARINVDGLLKTYACGQPCVLSIDPVEKGPASHFIPGCTTLTIAHAGCNLRCLYCQNWEFSQKSPCETNNLQFDTGESIRLAIQKRVLAVTFTYTEGTTHIEFNKKFALAARNMGLRTYLCTNGYVHERPLMDFLEVLEGVTVTIKGLRAAFYQKCIGADSVRPVLDTCQRIRKSGKWLEIATLIVPGYNDAPDELRSIARWICDNLGPHTPWHLERFAPKWRLSNLPPTPVPTMERTREMGMKAGLKFVYISNLAPHNGNHTYCPRCGRVLIERLGFKLLKNNLTKGHCPSCFATIPGIWA